MKKLQIQNHVLILWNWLESGGGGGDGGFVPVSVDDDAAVADAVIAALVEYAPDVASIATVATAAVVVAETVDFSDGVTDAAAD